jgi:hypothetical protein
VVLAVALVVAPIHVLLAHDVVPSVGCLIYKAVVVGPLELLYILFFDFVLVANWRVMEAHS